MRLHHRPEVLEVSLEEPLEHGHERPIERLEEPAGLHLPHPVDPRRRLALGCERVPGRPVPPQDALMRRRPSARSRSNSVTSMTLSIGRPRMPLTTARRRLPMPTGPSVSSSPLIAFAAHRGARVGSVRTRKTSATGRAMTTLMVACATGGDLPRRNDPAAVVAGSRAESSCRWSESLASRRYRTCRSSA